jgi:aspartate racemase
MKSVGIIGGLGPDITAQFYLDIVKKYRYYGKKGYPGISIYNVPVLFCAERDFSSADSSIELLPELMKAVDVLQDKVDFIAIPCNSAYPFIDDLRHHSKVPVVSMIEEVAVAIRSMGMDRAGLLATNKTIDAGIYDNVFDNMGMRLVKPRDEHRLLLNEVVYNVLLGSRGNFEKTKLQEVIRGLNESGSESLIIGCPDLKHVLDPSEVNMPVFDSLGILTDAVIKRM